MASSVHVDVDQLAAELNSVAIHLLRRIRATDVSLGMTPARLSALSVLVFAGPMSLKGLADVEQVSAPTMSKLVAALEQIPDEPKVETSRGTDIASQHPRRNVIGSSHFYGTLNS